MPIFDGHNDLLLTLWLHHHDDPARAFFQGIPQGQLDYPRMRQGGFIGGLFALFVPPLEYVARVAPDRIGAYPADPTTILWQQMAILQHIVAESDGRACLCLSAEDIQRCQYDNVLAMVAHIEGATGFDGNGDNLRAFHAAGVRSLGLFWNQTNRFGEGVNGPFPGSPDTGPGLTLDGIALIQQANALRMLVDVSHMNEKAFRDTARVSTAPLVATHSSVHMLCPQPRNLTDEQLTTIAASGGLVGVNFGNAFLRPDGKRDSDTPLTALLAHIDYLVTKIGIDHVALGSDFDGVSVPDALGDVAGLPRLFNALRQHGYDASMLEKIAWRNWLQMLRSIWGK